MGGKAAMALALLHPVRVSRLMVSDIAPVTYQHGNTRLAQAMQAIELTPALTRREADAALAAVEKRPDVRAFLLQNLRFGTPPRWRIALPEIAAAVPDLEGKMSTRCMAPPTDWTYCRFVTGAESNYVLPEHPSCHSRSISERPVRRGEKCRPLGARRQPGGVPVRGGGVPHHMVNASCGAAKSRDGNA